jgi:histone deacetylase complex subunit SAP18
MDSEVNMEHDVPPATPAGQPVVDREKVQTDCCLQLLLRSSWPGLQTAPFLIRAFIKIGTFHKTQTFEDGAVPTADEQQIFTWYDYKSIPLRAQC